MINRNRDVCFVGSRSCGAVASRTSAFSSFSLGIRLESTAPLPWAFRSRCSIVCKTSIFVTLVFAISSSCYHPLTSVSEWGIYKRGLSPA
jgi:hypothetical protein